MDEILHQLGGLVLGSVPTILLFLLVVVLYRLLVYGPLMRVLKERRARTEGAIEQANDAITAADTKAQEYETKLRTARVEIFQAREQRLRQWSGERERALADARATAQQRVVEAKTVLAQEAEEAHRAIEGSSEELAREILRAILPPDSVPDFALSGSSR